MEVRQGPITIEDIAPLHRRQIRFYYDANEAMHFSMTGWISLYDDATAGTGIDVYESIEAIDDDQCDSFIDFNLDPKIDKACTLRIEERGWLGFYAGDLKLGWMGVFVPSATEGWQSLIPVGQFLKGARNE